MKVSMETGCGFPAKAETTFNGLKLHQSSRSSTFATSTPSGHTAPSSIQRLSTPISELLSLDFGGIATSFSRPLTNRNSGLAALFPAMMLGA